MSNKLEGFSTSASTFNADLDFAFWLHIWLSIGLFLSVVVPMFYFAWKYNANKVKNDEILWTLIPVAIMMLFFYYGNTTMKMFRTMPAEAQSVVINVEGSKWKWKYTYPANASGHVHKIGGVYKKPVMNDDGSIAEHGTMGISALYVPKDTNIILKMTSPLNDVIHSYSYMYSKIVVMEKADYEAWYNSNKGDTPKGDFAKDGKSLYASNGCASCHSIDSDTVLVGPGLKGIGAKYDSKYLADAITNPDKDVPEGFYPGIMPTFKFSKEDLANIVKYMETGK
jgi:cytochrome c oxidase subunit 2